MKLLLIIVFHVMLIFQNALSFVNLALRRPAKMKSEYDSYYSVGPENAVDGYTDNYLSSGHCIHTEISRYGTVWWNVELEYPSTLKYLRIIYRNQFARRFAGFSIYVTDEEVEDSQFFNISYVYHDVGPELPPLDFLLDITDTVTGTFVTIYNNRTSKPRNPNYSTGAVLELCEVEVYGCPIGQYSNNCQLDCSEFCVEYICDPGTGVCIKGCEDGYIGSFCDDICDPGNFGASCNYTCHCRTGDCDHVTGICQEPGCYSGWYGDNCSLGCEDDTFGPDCTKTCFCEEGSCERYHGVCYTSGCQEGFKGPSCSEECGFGEYGPNCRKMCGMCDKNETCDAVNGTCNYGCMDGYNGYRCHQIIVKNGILEIKKKSTLASTVVGAIAVFVLIIAAVFVFLWWKRFHRKKILDQKFRDSIRSGFSRRSNLSEYEKEHAYCNIEVGPVNPAAWTETVETKKRKSKHEEGDIYANINMNGIAVEELINNIKKNKNADNFQFKQEYKSVPFGQHGKCDVGKLPENNPKNRFKNILPYDDSRVILDDGGGQASDYINASFIDGIDANKEYIASQAPKPSTVDDHWRMIWQENIDTIVMLTNLTEKGKAKCHRYWPNLGKAMDTRNFSVRLQHVKKYVCFIVRFLTVREKKINKERNVTMFHYTKWPDFGVPEALGIVHFHDYVMSHSNAPSVPLLVHCSAGIGRTGTFIGLDALLKQGKRTGRINVCEYLATMRRCRMNMVQTQDQYIFLHDALLEGLRYVKHTLSRSTFTEMAEMGTEDRDSIIRKQYEELESMALQYNDNVMKDGQDSNRTSLNSSECLLTVDKYRPLLKTDDGSCEIFKDAVYLSTYTEANGIIVTKFPSPDTVVRFWRLVVDQDISTVILLNTDNQEIESWIPLPSQSKAFDTFVIECTSEICLFNGTMQYKILVSKEESECVHTNVIVSSQWSTEAAVELAKTMSRISMKDTGTILIASSDSVARSCVISVVYNAIQQLTLDGEADIFNLVLQLRRRNSHFVGTFEEFLSCFASVEEYLQSETIYSNN